MSANILINRYESNWHKYNQIVARMRHVNSSWDYSTMSLTLDCVLFAQRCCILIFPSLISSGTLVTASLFLTVFTLTCWSGVYCFLQIFSSSGVFMDQFQLQWSFLREETLLLYPSHLLAHITPLSAIILNLLLSAGHNLNSPGHQGLSVLWLHRDEIYEGDGGPSRLDC